MFTRRATINDIDFVMEIEKSCFSSFIQEEKSILLERIKTFPQGFILLCHKNDVLGYCSTELWNCSYPEKLESKDFALNHSIFERHKSNAETLYISSIAVLPAKRGAGLGKFLFPETIKMVKEKNLQIKKIVLLVCSQWHVAKKIYTNYGFEKIGEIKDFFRLEENRYISGIIMKKII